MNTTEITCQDLRGVSETLLLPLYLRALETQRSDALLRDEWAVKLVEKLKLDASTFERAQLGEEV